MNADRPHPTDFGRTPREEAADWLALKRSGAMTAHDTRAFQVWLEADTTNRTAYANMEHYWEFSAGVRDDAQIMALRELHLRRVNRPARLRLAGVLAACLIASLGVGWGMLEAGAFNRLDWLAKPQETEFRTSVGQRTTVTLADGSVVTLDTDSALRTRESGRRRLVTLERGRAFFRVAKDHSRPFVVTAGGETVTAVGTAFDVRLDDGALEVTLAQGKVRIEQPREGFRRGRFADLNAGYRLTTAGSGEWRIAKVDPDTALSWVAGRLIFDGSMADAVAQMNRYSDRKLVLVGPDIADTPVVGVFRAGDVEGFAHAARIKRLARIGAQTDDRIELRSF